MTDEKMKSKFIQGQHEIRAWNAKNQKRRVTNMINRNRMSQANKRMKNIQCKV